MEPGTSTVKDTKQALLKPLSPEAVALSTVNPTLADEETTVRAKRKKSKPQKAKDSRD